MIQRCLFSDNPKKKFVDYAVEERADLIVLSAREKRGLFESSFTQYVNKHTDINLIVLKQKRS